MQGLPDGAASRGLLAAARRLEGYDAPFAPAAMHVTAADCHARLRDIRELARSNTWPAHMQVLLCLFTPLKRVASCDRELLS